LKGGYRFNDNCEEIFDQFHLKTNALASLVGKLKIWYCRYTRIS